MYSNIQNLVSVYKPTGLDLDHAVIYLHGGGLLFGERDDLRPHQKQPLLDAGLTLVCLDYPLSPETKVPELLDELYEELLDCIKSLLEHGIKSYSLFGRSAGAYLTLMMTARLQKNQKIINPSSVVDFYGYHRFDLPGMLDKNSHYLKQAQISYEYIEKLLGTKLYAASTTSRYALYVYARQTGTWGNLLGVDNISAQEKYRLQELEIKVLPPLFITAGTDDKDVPFSASKELRALAPQVTWVPQYYKAHLFDDQVNQENRELYVQLAQWIVSHL